jgi:hypothetical protein
MRTLAIIIATAVVTAFVTNFVALGYRDEKFAQLLWARCPQLILNPDAPEVSHILFLDGSAIPIHPRTPKPMGKKE